MNSSWRRILSLLLTLALVLGLTTPAFAADSSKSSKLNVSWEKVEAASAIKNQLLAKNKVKEFETPSLYKDSDTVRVSIVLSKKSTLDLGYAASSIATNAQAQAYREGLKADQKTIEQRISAQALGGEKLDVVWNLTLAANIISANVKFGQIEAIKKVAGVEDVIVETQYDPAVASKDELDPNMSVASGMTGGNQAWLEGYTGAGSAVAIVDTGLDIDHKSFDADAFDYAISTLDSDVDLIEKDEVAAVLDQLNASKFMEGLTVDDVYRNSKVPFAFNYVDGNTNISHMYDTGSEHGSHVSGIAAGNRYVKAEDGSFVKALDAVLTQGEAPDAQIFVMKVFGQGGGAYDSDYMAAIEDAIVLGAASTNLSLGSANAGMTTSYYEDVLDKVANSDMVLVMSAGNSYYWANSTVFGYLYAEDKNFDTVGSPGSFTNTFAVASVENDGVTGTYLEIDREMVFYSETSYGNEPITTVGGTHDYVYIDSYGANIDEDTGEYTVNMFENIDLTDKIGIANRGTSSFFVKANAIAEAGAIAAIIANNQDGVINMNLTGYKYKIPAISITKADAQLLKSAATSTETITYMEGETEKTATAYYGKLTVVADVNTVSYDSDYYTMSDFSSWGVPGNLSLKPEITAPGGNIYSVNGYHLDENGNPAGGHEDYENMSGTSMAAPQITGIAAVLVQYIKDNGLAEDTGLTPRQLATSLLMSTAEPLIDEEAGYYYPLIEQGAGLVRVDQAIKSKTYIIMDDDATASAKDGKVKAELGEVKDQFKVGFTIYNLSDELIEMDLSADFFTQDQFGYYTYDADGNPITYSDGSPVVSGYTATWTAPLESEVNWIIEGEAYEPAEYDINGDGKSNAIDISDLMSYLVGNITNTDGWDLEAADRDEDGDVDTHDAYLLLIRTTAVPAGGKIHVEATVSVDGLDEFVNGNYVEGFIYAEEKPTDEGVEGVSHSIPVLGFYGDWSAASMFDIGSYLEYAYGKEVRYPYMAAVYGEKSKYLTSFLFSIGGEDYYFGGNPFVTDTDEDGYPVYLPERDAVSSNIAISGLQTTQIRNAAATRLLITDDTTEETLYEQLGGGSISAYYHVNQGKWMNTISTWGFKDYAKVVNAADDDILTYSVSLATEYSVKEDGTVDWDALGAGATKSISAVVDNTAPEILDVTASVVTQAIEGGEEGGEEGEEPETVDVYTVSLKAKDNQYIAAVFLMDEAGYVEMATGTGDGDPIDYAGSDINAAKGAEYTHEFAYTSEDAATPNQIMIEVYDYAGNESVYKINLAKEEQYADEEAYSITLLPEEVTIIGKNSVQLDWLIDPWGIEDEEGFSLTFESSDPTVATVDENGLVTSVASDDARCTITATISYGEFSAEATCDINIRFFKNDLYGVIWDENGQINFSKFNLATIPEYEILAADVKNQIASVAIDPATGTMYAASFDSEEWTSSLYTVDPENGYALSKIGDSAFGYMDIAYASGLSEMAGANILLAVYGPYVLVVDCATGEYIGAYDYTSYLGNEYLVGIAYEEIYDATSMGYGLTDWVYLVDTAGNLYNAGFFYSDGFGYFKPSAVGNLGYETDEPYFNSLYLTEVDGKTNIYWSRFDEAASIVDLIGVIDFYESGEIYKIGTFAKDVWPVGGLYDVKSDAAVSGDSLARSKDVSVGTGSITKDVTKLVPSKPAAKGSINATKVGSGRVHPQGITPPDVTPAIVANYEITADVNTNNGLVVVNYDPKTVEVSVVSIDTDLYDYKVDAKKGILTFAYANRQLIEKDGVIAKLRVFMSDTDCGSTFSVYNKQINNGEGSVKTESLTNHVWGDVVWSWADDYSLAVASKVCKNNPDHIQEADAVVTSETTAETCTEAGKITYTATAVIDGETYTDIQEVEIPATGHDWGDVTYTWADDNSSATATHVCANDPTHVETETADAEITEVPATETKTGSITYTVEFANEAFETQIKTEILPKLIVAGWKQNAVGWWYQNADGTWPANQWQEIDGEKYYFNAKGYKQTGWIQLDDIWYYLDEDGAMQTGWQLVNGKWYFMNESGEMQTGWLEINGNKFYLRASGAMQTGWGKIDDVWYYFGDSGIMKTGWQKVNNIWYYLGADGQMCVGWHTINGKTYYFKPSGAMAANEWYAGWWLNADGTWTYYYMGSWKEDNKGWKFSDTSGWYAKNETIRIDNSLYTFDAEGYWVK